MKENADDVALAAKIRSEHIECIDPHCGENQSTHDHSWRPP